MKINDLFPFSLDQYERRDIYAYVNELKELNATVVESNYLFRVEIEFDPEHTVSSRFLYTTLDLAKEGLVAFLIDECVDEFIELELPQPAVNNVEWRDLDLGSNWITGTLLGWTYTLNIHRMEIQ